MSSVDLFRVARRGFNDTVYGPYDQLCTARTVRTQQYGSGWNNANGYRGEIAYAIQKLTPVLKPLDNGSLQLAMEWVNVD